VRPCGAVHVDKLRHSLLTEAEAAEDPGRAVQVDPMTPKLKPPGIKRVEAIVCYTAVNFCFQNQLVPLHPGIPADVRVLWESAAAAARRAPEWDSAAAARGAGEGQGYILQREVMPCQILLARYCSPRHGGWGETLMPHNTH